MSDEQAAGLVAEIINHGDGSASAWLLATALAASLRQRDYYVDVDVKAWDVYWTLAVDLLTELYDTEVLSVCESSYRSDTFRYYLNAENSPPTPTAQIG